MGLALPAAPPTGATSLAIAGRSNATPWVASDGPLVAVVWGASIADKTDVFLAVSHDSGKTFGTPVQVNAIPGEARLGGELPPRVAVTAGRGPSTAEVVVLWTARGAATSIKTARSRDGGRTFEPPVELQGAGAEGDRGWPSLALDSRGTAHAIWLDHRGLAAARVAGASRDHKAAPRTTAWRWPRSRGSITPPGQGRRRRAASWPRASATAARRRWPPAPIRRCMPRGVTCTRAISGISPSRSRATEAARLPSPSE